jgi:hypothetical protein
MKERTDHAAQAPIDIRLGHREKRQIGSSTASSERSCGIERSEIFCDGEYERYDIIFNEMVAREHFVIELYHAANDVVGIIGADNRASKSVKSFVFHNERNSTRRLVVWSMWKPILGRIAGYGDKDEGCYTGYGGSGNREKQVCACPE